MFGGKKKSDSKSAEIDSFDNNHSDPNTIVYSSWLNKKGKIHKAMQLRYCVAYTDRKLSYFRKQDDDVPAGYIDLSEVTAINMYLPKLFNKTKNNKNKKHQQSHSLNEMDDYEEEMKIDSFDFTKLNKLKRDRSCSLHLKETSSNSDNNEFKFELVTSSRIWIFSCSDLNIFEKWMCILRDLCFGKLLHSGYLRKTGQRYKTWRRRYFIIYDLNEIRYFENDTLLSQKGKIDLNTVTKITSSKPNQYHYQYCIELHTPERIWILATDTSKQRDIWINGIRNIMKQHERTFIPSNTGFLSLYDENTYKWKKYYFAVFKNKMENQLCCFAEQINCKQLESMVSFGDQQFNMNCKSKMKQIISLKQLINALIIQQFEFKMVNEKCKQDMSDKKFLFTIKLQNTQYYFAPHPNTQKNAQKWVNIIKNLKSSERQNIYSKLVKLGYKSSYIGAALEQYESAYGTKQYDYNEIKAMIDRMAKPETGSTYSMATTSSKTDSNSLTSPLSNPLQQRLDIGGLQILNEEKSFSLDQDNNKDKKDINASYHKVLDTKNYSSWNTNDVLLWIKGLENGLIINTYPQIIKGFTELNINGSKLKQLNEMNLQQLGVKDELHRALVLEALSNL